MRRFIVATLLTAAALLGGCAGAPVVERPAGLFLDDRFAAPSEPIRADDIFALSEPMRRMLEGELARQARTKGRQAALIDALYNRRLLRLEYDAATTRNASQAFEARSGNCLSLVIMTAAFAKELGLQVRYQSAFTDETWSRSADLYLRSGHVNVSLGRRLTDAGSSYDLSITTVDFLPAERIRGLRTREVDEATIVAMFMNNRSAEALVQGRLDDAYWWAREAVQHDAGFLSAYNTLGVVYLRNGELAAAERALQHVLRHEPQNTRAMSNYAMVLDRSGRTEASAALRQEIARIEPNPPFHFFDLGQAAMQRGDFAAARDLFARELARTGEYHELHYWLGVAYYRLGETEQASRHLKLAMDSSGTRGLHDLYAAKLAWLKGSVRGD